MRQNTLYQLNNTPFPLSSLSDLYPKITHITDKARRLEQEERIIRLKKGLYVRSVEDGALPMPGLIANHLYGPSYVSLQTALRHYGLIPERVYETQSMTIKHSRSFETPLGVFSYFSCPVDYFPIGIRQHQEGETSFLIASPEKAMCDILVKTQRLKIESTDSLIDYLENDLRFDCEALKTFDTDILQQCHDKTATRKKNISTLISLVENEQQHI